MSKKILITTFVFLLTILLFLLGIKNLATDSSLSLMNLNEISSSWLPLVDYSSNSFYMWKFYRVIFKISALISEKFSIHFNDIIFYIHLFIFFISNIFLSNNVIKKISLPFSIFTSFCFTSILILFFGNKTYVISSISFLPLFILSIKSLFEARKNLLLHFLFFVFSLILLIKTANQFSFFYIILSFLTLKALASEYKFNKLILSIFIISLLASLSYIVFSIPNLPTIDYPWYAKVVKDDGLAGNITPLINEGTPIPYINEEAEKNTFSGYMFFLIIFIALVIFKLYKNKSFKFLSFLILFFVVSFVLELYFPNSISSLMFIKTIQRVVPSLFYFSLYPVFLFWLIFSFYLLCIKKIQNFTFFYILCYCFAFFTLIFGISHPIFMNNSSLEFINKIKTGKLLQNKNFRKILFSPSNTVLMTSGKRYFTRKKIYQNEKSFVNIKNFNPILLSNFNGKDVHNILKKSPKKRWSTGTGKQEAKEEILIKFPKKITVTGIIIDTGNYITDYPNKFEILSYENYTPSLVYEGENLGKIEWTASGYPFYSTQNIIKVLFKKRIRTNELKIINKSKNENFDWSISSIKILNKDKK